MYNSDTTVAFINTRTQYDPIPERELYNVN